MSLFQLHKLDRIRDVCIADLEIPTQDIIEGLKFRHEYRLNKLGKLKKLIALLSPGNSLEDLRYEMAQRCSSYSHYEQFLKIKPDGSYVLDLNHPIFKSPELALSIQESEKIKQDEDARYIKKSLYKILKKNQYTKAVKLIAKSLTNDPYQHKEYSEISYAISNAIGAVITNNIKQKKFEYAYLIAVGFSDFTLHNFKLDSDEQKMFLEHSIKNIVSNLKTASIDSYLSEVETFTKLGFIKDKSVINNFWMLPQQIHEGIRYKLVRDYSSAFEQIKLTGNFIAKLLTNKMISNEEIYSNEDLRAVIYKNLTKFKKTNENQSSNSLEEYKMLITRYNLMKPADIDKILNQ